MGSVNSAPRPASQDATSETGKPVAVFRFGDISAAVFADEAKTKDGRTIRVAKVSIRRSYREADGTWQPTSSLRRDDLLPAAHALMKCYDFIAGDELLGER